MSSIDVNIINDKEQYVPAKTLVVTCYIVIGNLATMMFNMKTTLAWDADTSIIPTR